MRTVIQTVSARTAWVLKLVGSLMLLGALILLLFGEGRLARGWAINGALLIVAHFIVIAVGAALITLLSRKDDRGERYEDE